MLGAVALSGVNPDELFGMVISSHSMLSKFVSGRSRDKQELVVVNCESDVSIGDCE